MAFHIKEAVKKGKLDHERASTIGEIFHYCQILGEPLPKLEVLMSLKEKTLEEMAEGGRSYSMALRENIGEYEKGLGATYLSLDDIGKILRRPVTEQYVRDNLKEDVL